MQFETITFCEVPWNIVWASAQCQHSAKGAVVGWLAPSPVVVVIVPWGSDVVAAVTVVCTNVYSNTSAIWMTSAGPPAGGVPGCPPFGSLSPSPVIVALLLSVRLCPHSFDCCSITRCSSLFDGIVVFHQSVGWQAHRAAIKYCFSHASIRILCSGCSVLTVFTCWLTSFLCSTQTVVAFDHWCWLLLSQLGPVTYHEGIINIMTVVLTTPTGFLFYPLSFLSKCC